MTTKTIKILIATILAIIILFASTIASSPSIVGENFWSKNIKTRYDDMAGFDWASNSVSNLSSWGIISGSGNNKFHPEDTMTRAEFAKILVCAFGMYDENSKIDMFDVPKDEWYYSYVASSVNNNLASGYSDEWFGAHDNITREDIATLLYKAINRVGFQIEPVLEDVNYKDFDNSADYSKEAIIYLSERKIFSGDGDNLFRPKDNALRAEVAVLIYQILGNAKF
jgi:hypothetical protein